MLAVIPFIPFRSPRMQMLSRLSPPSQQRQLTPLQRSMVLSNRRRRWTSIRFISIVFSMIFLVIVPPFYSLASILWDGTLTSSSSTRGTQVIASWEEVDDDDNDDNDSSENTVTSNSRNDDYRTSPLPRKVVDHNNNDDDDDDDHYHHSVLYERDDDYISPKSKRRKQSRSRHSSSSHSRGHTTNNNDKHSSSHSVVSSKFVPLHFYYPWSIFRTNNNGGDRNNNIRDNDSSSDDGDDSTNNDDGNDNSEGKGRNADDDSEKAKGDDHGKQQQQPSSSSQHHHSSSTTEKDGNPSVYGWTPTQYPNPLHDPMRCAVAYILPHLTTPTPESESSSSSKSSKNNNKTTAMLPPNLRLCDPDWVLGGVFLEEVASAMYNFSLVFGPPMDNNDDGDDDEEWNVEVGPSNRRRMITEIQQSTKKNGVMDQQRDSGDGRKLLYHRQLLRSAEILPISAASATTTPTIELAVATVRKMNLASVLRQSTYYSSYEDEDDMVNDAAQIFARVLHDSWWNTTSSNNNNNHNADHGILLFLSVQDRVCFISTGSAVSTILPWWRLDHIVASMKPDLRHRDYGNALLRAIADLSHMLEAGPPTLSDRLHDFISRFGLVIAFAMFTFVFGAWGEYRDRRKRWHYAEQRSKLTGIERQKAQQLQQEFRTRCCPICLENYDYGDRPPNADVNTEQKDANIDTSSHTYSDGGTESNTETTESKLREESSLSVTWKGAVVVDEYGIPRRGADGKKIKLLRCGHIFCETCWKSWVHSSACGSPCNCPVCRQDVGVCVCRVRRNVSVPTAQSHSSTSSSMVGTVSAPELSSDSLIISTSETPPRLSYDSLSDTVAGGNRLHGSNNNSRMIRVSTMLGGSVLFRQSLFHRRAEIQQQQPRSVPTQPPVLVNETMPLLLSGRSPNCDVESTA